MREAIDEALAAIAAIPHPYRDALTGEPASIDAALEAVRALQRLLGTEVVAVLGATLAFNGNDGD